MNRKILAAIESASHCHRNWDLSRRLSKDEIEILYSCVKKSPTKQNDSYYEIEFIEDRHIIEKIYQASTHDEFTEEEDYKNSQVLANLLTIIGLTKGKDSNNKNYEHEYARQSMLSIGIVTGQLLTTANLIGLKTGCCSCFDQDKLKNLSNIQNPVLIIGIGYPNQHAIHAKHQTLDYIYPSFTKYNPLINQKNLQPENPLPNKQVVISYCDGSSRSTIENFEHYIDRNLAKNITFLMRSLAHRHEIYHIPDKNDILLGANSDSKIQQFYAEVISHNLIKQLKEASKNKGNLSISLQKNP